MAGTKISGLAALTTVADGDLFPVVDVSDTTQAPTGTTKAAPAAVLAAGIAGSAEATEAEARAGASSTTLITPRRLLDIMPHIDIRWFGAVGDGITDDTVAIQAALDSVGVDGATVYFPNGIYLVTTLGPKNNTLLVGGSRPTFGLDSFLGVRNAVIKQKASTNLPLITDHALGIVYAVTLRNLVLDGNKANQSTPNHGVHLIDTGAGTDAQWQFENLLVRDCTGDGIRAGNFRRSNRILSCDIVGCDGNAVSLLSTDNTVFDTNPAQSGGHGIYLEQGRNHFVGCNVFSNDLCGMSMTSSVTDCMVENCVFDLNGQDGINLAGARNAVVACSFNDNSASADNTYSNITLDFPNTTAVQNSIIGSTHTHVASNAWKSKYGVVANVNVVVLGMSYSLSSSPFGTGSINNIAGNAGPLGAVIAAESVGLVDGANFHVGATTGTKFGGSALAKLGFYGATAVVQPNAVTVKTALETLGLGASLTDEDRIVVVGASDLTDQLQGVPARSTVGGMIPAWLMDAATDERVAAVLGGRLLNGWATMTAQVVWAASGVTTGDVVWQVNNYGLTSGAALSLGGASGDLISAAPGVADQVVITAASAAYTVAATTVKGLRVRRDGANVLDTYAADAKLIAVVLTRAT